MVSLSFTVAQVDRLKLILGIGPGGQLTSEAICEAFDKWLAEADEDDAVAMSLSGEGSGDNENALVRDMRRRRLKSLTAPRPVY